MFKCVILKKSFTIATQSIKFQEIYLIKNRRNLSKLNYIKRGFEWKKKIAFCVSEKILEYFNGK